MIHAENALSARSKIRGVAYALTVYPVTNPRPWGASLTISTIVILAYMALALYL